METENWDSTKAEPDYPAAGREVKAGEGGKAEKRGFVQFTPIFLPDAAECRIIPSGTPVRLGGRGGGAGPGPTNMRRNAMNVATILKAKGSDVSSVSPETTVRDVALLLTERRIGAVLVMQERQVMGIISERDIVKAVARDGGNALNAPVRDVMTSRVVTCGLNDSVDELMDSMTQGRFRHLPVIEKGEVVGIVSIGDVVKHRIAETVMETEAMRLYIANG